MSFWFPGGVSLSLQTVVWGQQPLPHSWSQQVELDMDPLVRDGSCTWIVRGLYHLESEPHSNEEINS